MVLFFTLLYISLLPPSFAMTLSLHFRAPVGLPASGTDLIYRLLGWGVLVPTAFFLLYIALNEFVRYSTRIANLPGPRGYPLVGSLPDLRGKIPAEEYRKWAKQYGDVFQLQLGNTTTVVVNSASAARDFFISQRNATSGRPLFYVLHKKVQKGNAVTSIGTSEWDHSCRRRRKVAAAALNKTSVESYLPVSLLKLEIFGPGFSLTLDRFWIWSLAHFSTTS
jgi:3-hydroxyphenylacetate 6-hydroxylase